MVVRGEWLRRVEGQSNTGDGVVVARPSVVMFLERWCRLPVMERFIITLAFHLSLLPALSWEGAL
jgi:hypothetical protein